MKIFTKSIMPTLFVILGCMQMTAQLTTWNANNWSARDGATAEVSGTTLVVTASTDNTANVYYNSSAVTLSSNETWMAVKLKANNATLSDPTLTLEYYLVDDNGTAQKIFSQINKGKAYAADTDGNNIADTYFFDLKNILGTAFVDGYQFHTTNMNWENGTSTTPGAYRGTIRLNVNATPDASGNPVTVEITKVQTYFSVQQVMADLNAKGIDWNPTTWMNSGTGIVNTIVDNTLEVSNLVTSGSNYRADLVYKNPFTFDTSKPFLALKLKTINSTLSTADRKLQVLSQLKDNANVQYGFNQENKQTGNQYDTDGNGIYDTYIWDLSSAVGTYFTNDTTVFATLNSTGGLVWANGSGARSFRGNVKFTVIVVPDGGKTQADIFYKVFYVGTFATQEAALTYLLETSTSDNTGKSEKNFRYYSENGTLHIISNKAQSIIIYGIDGRLVQKMELVEGENLTNLPKGIYIVNNQKIIVK